MMQGCWLEAKSLLLQKPCGMDTEGEEILIFFPHVFVLKELM